MYNSKTIINYYLCCSKTFNMCLLVRRWIMKHHHTSHRWSSSITTSVLHGCNLVPLVDARIVPLCAAHSQASIVTTNSINIPVEYGCAHVTSLNYSKKEKISRSEEIYFFFGKFTMKIFEKKLGSESFTRWLVGGEVIHWRYIFK